MTLPCAGTNPVIASMNVVLPAPFGPISPTSCPSSTSRSTLSSACTPPTLTEIPLACSPALIDQPSPCRCPRSSCRLGRMLRRDTRAGAPPSMPTGAARQPASRTTRTPLRDLGGAAPGAARGLDGPSRWRRAYPERGSYVELVVLIAQVLQHRGAPCRGRVRSSGLPQARPRPRCRLTATKCAHYAPPPW